MVIFNHQKGISNIVLLLHLIVHNRMNIIYDIENYVTNLALMSWSCKHIHCCILLFIIKCAGSVNIFIVVYYYLLLNELVL